MMVSGQPRMPTEEPPLPTVYESVLDEAGVDALFEELARDGEGITVLLKGDVQARAGGGADLAEARALLRDGKTFGVQIRCRLGGAAWLYTLMQAPHGIRLVRIEQQ
jgi:hypothetical protein